MITYQSQLSLFALTHFSVLDTGTIEVGLWWVSKLVGGWRMEEGERERERERVNE